MYTFKARLEIIDINPFVAVPDSVLKKLFRDAGKDKGAIPIHGTLNGQPYRQTLVRFRQAWRLYVNTTMLKNSPKKIGERLVLTVGFDTSDRSIKIPATLKKALQGNKEALQVFDSLSPSRRNEIIRYIAHLKTAESIERNVLKAIDFLIGKGRFAGRDKP